MKALKPDTIVPGAGHFDRVVCSPSVLDGFGWIFRRPYKIDRADLFVDGTHCANCEPMNRPDVAETCRWAPESRPFGFRFQISSPALRETWCHRIDVIGYAAQRPVARVSTFCPSLHNDHLPLPPPALAERVSGVAGEHFRLQGLKMFTDLIDVLRRYAVPLRGRLLDWGCGCARVLRWFFIRDEFVVLNTKHSSAGNDLPVGCDVDPEALEWCRSNLNGCFALVPFDPPTSLPSGAYDLVIACSVLTHLDRFRQQNWLEEVHRWLAPGGYFIASTNAEFAFRSKHPHLKPNGVWKFIEQWAAAFCRPRIVKTILDDMPDPSIRWFVPEQEYRMVFQSRTFTEQLCARFFDVVGYVECGLDGFQDVIVCRKSKV
ncbi:MAG: class I SAM-dependent methyltransferase [Candidatus Sumerlaeaceae bacterium]|nr:class I SAM-dependent methyltransferase [Candidatus Sumerlaeaceae bacterium]